MDRQFSSSEAARKGGDNRGLYDTEDTTNNSLEHDWYWAVENKLDSFIAKHDRDGKSDPQGCAERVKQALRECYGAIMTLFDYYASAGTDLDVFSIGPNEFNMLLEECELGVKGSPECEKHHLEQMFIAVDAGQKVKEAFNLKRALSRSEFLQILVRTAVARYMRPPRGTPPAHTSVSEALMELLTEQMQPRLTRQRSKSPTNSVRPSYTCQRPTSLITACGDITGDL